MNKFYIALRCDKETKTVLIENMGCTEDIKIHPDDEVFCLNTPAKTYIEIIQWLKKETEMSGNELTNFMNKLRKFICKK